MKTFKVIRSATIASLLLTGIAQADDVSSVIDNMANFERQNTNTVNSPIYAKITIHDYINANVTAENKVSQVVSTGPIVTIQDYIEAANADAR